MTHRARGPRRNPPSASPIRRSLTRSLLALPLLALPLVGCEQQESQGRADGGVEPGDYRLPDVGERPDGGPVELPSPPDPCTQSQAVDFVARAAAGPGGSLVYEGQLQDDAGFAGSCGGGGPEAFDQVVRFAAPEAGTWQFLLTPRALRGQVFAQYDPVLHVRRTCGAPEDEVACNDDIASGRLESRVRLNLEAGDEVFLIVDTVGRAINARYELTARRLPIVALGEPCDVASEQNACPDGTYCRTDPQVRGPEGICAADDPPVIESVQAFASGDDLGLVIEGVDEGADVDRALLNLLDAEGQIIQLNAQGADTYILRPLEPTFGQREVRFRFSSNLLAGFPQTEAVQVRLLDAREHQSEPVTAEPSRPGPVAAGGACDVARIRNVCAQGTACLDPTGAGEARCVAPTAPVLVRAKGAYDPETLLVGFLVDGVDPDRDATGMRLELLDADGDIAASGDVPFDFVRFEEDAFTAMVSVRLNRDRGLVSARLVPFDAEGLRGPAFDAGRFGPPLVADEGDPCDPLGAQAECRGGAACFQADADSLPACGVPEVQCPEAWGEPVDLAAWADGDVWRYRGDLTTRYNVTRGSCGGGSAQTILRFTPPEDGVYTFVTYSLAGGADTVLYARSHCGYDPARAAVERACNDDISIENAFSLLTLALRADEPVFVFVDGASTANGAWRGPYTLTVRRQP